MKLDKLLEVIRERRDCKVFRPAGLPLITPGHRLPDDLKQFYESCGGVTLFEEAEYSARISAGPEFVLANPVIVKELVPEDISSSWYIVASDGKGDYLTIDLAPERLGRCYDSFWDRHGVAGSCPIIALSFTDLLERLVENAGQHWYWLRPTFISLGDAYDGAPA